MKLNYSYQELISLPTLPESLTELDCYNNQLTNLPTLPSSLTQLYCSDNQLTNLDVSKNVKLKVKALKELIIN